MYQQKKNILIISIFWWNRGRKNNMVHYRSSSIQTLKVKMMIYQPVFMNMKITLWKLSKEKIEWVQGSRIYTCAKEIGFPCIWERPYPELLSALQHESWFFSFFSLHLNSPLDLDILRQIICSIYVYRHKKTCFWSKKGFFGNNIVTKNLFASIHRHNK